MAQRHRAGSEQHAGSSTQHQPYISSASSSSSNLLSTQPTKHPLGLSSSTPHQNSAEGYARRRRRSPAGSNESHSHFSEHDIAAREKTKEDAYKNTALDKLENWLGISPYESPNRTLRPSDVLLPSPKAIGRPTPRPNSSRTTQLVVVHTVSSEDTLESIALRYKSDIRVIRRANGFWPGDSVTTRKELYIPISEDSEFNQTATAQASESLGGKLFLLNNMETETFTNGLYSQNRPLSSRSISSMSAASQSQLGQHASSPSQEVRRITLESLSHFPPPGTSLQKKGKEKRDNEPAFAYAEDMRPGRDVDHGETGVDDLLQLAEKARSRGGSPPNHSSQAKPLQSRRSSLDELESVSPSSSFLALEEPWKPNKWTLGEKSTKSGTSQRDQMQSNGKHNDQSRSSIEPAIPSSETSRTYNGWNDIPEPPLSRTAKGQVAHAYKGGSKARRYPRSRNISFTSPSANLIEDLAAGLPPNPGAAANWARPIADSLPLPNQGSRKLHTSRSFTRAHNGSQGWAQLFSDTVRGKMGLDEALERGFEDIRKLTISTTSTNGHTQHVNGDTAARRKRLLQADVHSNTPARPSAELARATLSEGQSAPSSMDASAGTGLDARRTSERSIHELEELDGNGTLSSNRILYAGNDDEQRLNPSLEEVRRRERKSIRNVDWLN